MATCASIVKHDLPENAAEDSYDLMPLFTDPGSGEYKREATVHHSINGSFAIRKGNWKLILCPGSGGWSFPRPNETEGLPPYQLYNLENDPGETENLYAEYPEIVQELKQVLTGYIRNGRSAPGEAQENDYVEKWPQVAWMDEK